MKGLLGMRTEELYSRLNQLGFIENYYATRSKEDKLGQTYRVLKIYDDDAKLAEVSLEAPYMLRTTFPGFEKRNVLEQQALLKILIEYSRTPIEKRRSEMYFAYYYDLNNIPHFIKRLRNGRLTDDTIPFAYFSTMSDEEMEKYLFTGPEFDDFPEDYRPRFRPDSFVKVTPIEEFRQDLRDRFSSFKSDENGQ
ncbi:hypothetical protein [Aerococcus kribbianus]|uniref:Uncharacterized protein n=1 Tax=Aerococcus kribbianus TaxID=2999064 RepID=A0A9X3FUQ1_9LACT|nr:MULTISPECIES: hypothetical protein [unclassified Aerococcus]MCZ0717266.1 hypothetical protein [Aerococcus sp. YH-aer221]MCZ0725554.1 hypothetical protein [Aerococcus sp. YH-aer222]